MSIKDYLRKIKPLATVAVFLMVAAASFGLGRLSAVREARTPIILGASTEFTNPADVARTVIKETSTGAQNSKILPTPASSESEGIVVASKQGKSYHLPWCSGAKRISAENKITFPSRAEAEKAGFLPAKNCKGLTAE